MMFNHNEIWAYPTDTSFGLGVRADDPVTLQQLYELKQRPSGKYFSLMVKDFAMLQQFAEVPTDFSADFFTEHPRTVILKPTKALPASEFWPTDQVAFRVCTIPAIAQHIPFPITATSANLSGEPPIFDIEKIRGFFGEAINVYEEITQLPASTPSEIWNFTVSPPQQIR